MKIVFYLIAFTLCLWSCSVDKHEELKQPDVLYFQPCLLNSTSLTGEVLLTGDISQQELSLKVRLKNRSNGIVQIDEIRIETEEGIQAKNINPEDALMEIYSGADTTVSLRFIPINDYMFYMLTEKNGQFNQVYKLSIQIKDNEGIKSIQTQMSVANEDFKEYKEQHVQDIIAYQFKTSDDFENKQMKYMKLANLGTTFINVSDQEIAVAGLNFKMQAYCENDSLHAKLYIVNHAEFPVGIDTSKFDIRPKSVSITAKRRLKYFKITGMTKEHVVLRKGDRVILELTKYLKDRSNEPLVVMMNKTFVLPNAQPLFISNAILDKF